MSMSLRSKARLLEALRVKKKEARLELQCIMTEVINIQPMRLPEGVVYYMDFIHRTHCNLQEELAANQQNA